MHLQAWASKTKILFIAHLLKTDISIFPKAVNDLQVHSGKLLQLDLQILNLKMHTEFYNKHHFEVVLSILRSNRTMP